jgi:beta-galactosidase
MALFRPNVSHDYDNGLADLLDVVGQNYRENEILAAHVQKPTRKILGTENGHDRKAWLALRDNLPYAGQFLWSGADYLGEAHVWPYIANSSGLLDRTDFPHARGLERQSWWATAPMVRMVRRIAPAAAAPLDPGEATDPKRPRETLFADWTPLDLSPHTEDVEVYSNAAQVELMLNGRSLSAQAIHTDASPRVWHIPFEAGTLQAIARNNGQVVATDELRTAGKPARIVLIADHPEIAPGWNNVGMVTATVVDDNGVVVPRASNLIMFQVNGRGSIAAVDNGDNTSHESFQGSQRSAYEGRCVAFLKANETGGDITVSASSAGLAPATISVQAARP